MHITLKYLVVAQLRQMPPYAAKGLKQLEMWTADEWQIMFKWLTTSIVQT